MENGRWASGQERGIRWKKGNLCIMSGALFVASSVLDEGDQSRSPGAAGFLAVLWSAAASRRPAFLCRDDHRGNEKAMSSRPTPRPSASWSERMSEGGARPAVWHRIVEGRAFRSSLRGAVLRRRSNLLGGVSRDGIASPENGSSQ